MANRKKIIVDTEGKNDQLRANLKQSEGAVSSFAASTTSKLGKIKAIIGGIGSALLVAFGARALMRYTSSLINLGDQIGKTSKRIGVTTEDFQKLAFAARRTGSSTETVERGFKRMQSTIFDAGAGLKASEDALHAIGLTFDVLDQKSPERQFKLIAGALNQVEDSTTKAALAQDIFGRAGTDLLPMLGEYASLSKEIENMGGIIKDKDIKAAEAFKDSMENLSTAIKASVVESGLLTWLADVASGIEEVKKARDTLKEGGQGDGKTGYQKFNEGVANNSIIEKYKLLDPLVQWFMGVGGEIGSDAIVTPEQIEANRNKVLDRRQENSEVAAAKDAANGANTNRAVDTALKDMFADIDKEAVKARGALEKADKDAAKAAKSAAQALERQIEQQERLVEASKKAQEALREFKEDMAMDKQAQAMAGMAADQQKHLNDLRAQLRQFQDAEAKAKGRFNAADAALAAGPMAMVRKQQQEAKEARAKQDREIRIQKETAPLVAERERLRAKWGNPRGDQMGRFNAREQLLLARHDAEKNLKLQQGGAKAVAGAIVANQAQLEAAKADQARMAAEAGRVVAQRQMDQLQQQVALAQANLGKMADQLKPAQIERAVASAQKPMVKKMTDVNESLQGMRLWNGAR